MRAIPGPSGRDQHMRQKASELSQAAERTSDPEHRVRLRQKAQRLLAWSEQDGRETDGGAGGR
ncbi:DUF6381 family protein [Streptomyces fulvorobeus]|uniref:Small hydrophilic protein n=1 Tax=Streptomyces fulvorobeus TaxID=284028 RepID=A0A7J0C1B0_9ACTN|nr:DUF6381 family protein [Streptomyces fulvorobeus]NYE39489.1 hypothetical protein [Streptomyces fulvorobeus]GFM95723.1 hypothetical protein Sfulv_05340 [Streptomyces fulvorobeus]